MVTRTERISNGMKIFFDTNVLIAAFVSRGICNELFEHCLERHTLCFSEQVIDELKTALLKKFDFPKESIVAIITFIQSNLVLLTYSPLLEKVCRDVDDDNILAAAVSGKVDCIITGDEDLLILKEFQKIPIVAPSSFWKFEKEKGR